MNWHPTSVKGYAAEALHGDMKQDQRDKVMAKFRNGSLIY
jgi:ATP-dependent RNA helicase DeaD